jgi:[ribosomal protein S18]-alanine N-acetyltransferase
MTINIEITEKPDTHTLHLLHKACFDRTWSETELDGLLAQTGCIACISQGGFALARLAAGEAELLTLAVEPAARRHGIGLALLHSLLGWLREQQAESLFLEVNHQNLPALKLYEKLGMTQVGRRKAYYTMADGSQEDALILRLAL